MSKNTEASNPYRPDQELSSDPRKAGGFIGFTETGNGLRGQGTCSLS